MIKHIVMWRLKETADGRGRGENARLIKSRLESLRGVIPGLIGIEVGIDFSDTPDSADIVLYSEFETREALDAYHAHPAHEAVKPLVLAARTERRLVDYEGWGNTAPFHGHGRTVMKPIRMPVEEFTTPDPITATEDMVIEDLRQLMENHGIRHLPVISAGSVIGVISDRDVRIVLGLPDADKFQVRAGDIMAPAPLTVSASEPLDEVAYKMSERKVGSVIVLDEKDQFLGIFTATDALNALIEIVRGDGASRS